MAIVGVPRIGDESVLAAPDGLAHTWVQLTGGRVVEHQLELGMVPNRDGAELGAHALLQVVAHAECVVFEARTRQCRAGLDVAVESRLHHEQIVVPGLVEDMPGLALDQVAQHIVRHAPADRAQQHAVLT